MSKNPNIPMVKAVYSSPNSARHPVHGSVSVHGGRPLSYGHRKTGDVFNVAEVDIVARPDLFLAYPCQEPFIIKGNTVVVPCGIEEVKSEYETLEDIPGVGPSTAEKLVELGLYTPEDVREKADDGILSSLAPPTRKKIRKWQEETG